MRYVIFNADDFGLTPGVTDGVLEAHQNGLLTSASLLIGAPDAARAARLARSCPRLGTGIHLALTTVRPILPDRRVRSLVGPDGHFPYSFLPVATRLSLGQIDVLEVAHELEAQILAMQDLGLTITHVDGHNHLHVHPTVLPIVIKLMQIHNIPAIRVPRPGPTSPGGSSSVRTRQALKGYMLRAATLQTSSQVQKAGLCTTDHFIGFEHSGHYTAERLLEVLTGLPPGTTEVMLHPGHRDEALEREHAWGYDWEGELAGMLEPEVAALVRKEHISLVHYGTMPVLDN